MKPGVKTPRGRAGSRRGYGRLLAVAASAAVLTVIAAAGCGPSGRPPGGADTTAASPRSQAPTPTSRPATGTPGSSCAGTAFAQMTPAQRVGQLFLVGLAGNQLGPGSARAIRQYHFGSVMFIAPSTAGVAAIGSVSAAVQSLASPAATGNARFFVGANQEGGQIQPLAGPGFATIPPAVVQGATPAAELRRQAATWGASLRAAGVNLNLAPVMDVVPAGTEGQNRPIGALQREYGHDVVTVSTHGVAFIRGMRAAGVSTTAKHFPGLGRVQGNTDYSARVVDPVTGPADPYLQTFQAAITAGVRFVMVALATYPRIDPRHLAVFSPVVMRTLLRGQLHFRGVVISDDLGAAAAVAGTPRAQRAIDFLSAGGDMITSKTIAPAAQMARAVLSRAQADPTFGRTVAVAVRHVLQAKQAAGLLDCPGR